MTAREFREEVVRLGEDQGLPRSDLEAAVRFYLEVDRPVAFGREHVRKTIQFAGQLATQSQASRLHRAAKGEEAWAEAVGKRRAWNDRLLEAVAQLRMRLFGSERPPFARDARGANEAALWILDQHSPRDHIKTQGVNIHRREPETTEAQAKLAELTRLSGFDHTMSIHWRRISFFAANERGWFLNTLTVPAKAAALALLADQTRSLAEFVGVPQEEMVRFVMCGVRPDLRAYHVEISERTADLIDGTRLLAHQLVIRAYDPLTFRQLRAAHAEGLRLWAAQLEKWSNDTPEQAPSEEDLIDAEIAAAIMAEIEGPVAATPEPRVTYIPSAVTENDQRLAPIVQRLGGVDGRARRGFWEDVAAEWAQLGYEAAAPNTLRMRWTRLQGKSKTVEPQAPSQTENEHAT